MAYRAVNERLTSPSGFSDAGVNWNAIANVVIAGSSIVVQLNNDASGIVIADGVRIERMEGDKGADDDLHVQSGALGIDAGDPLSYHLVEPTPSGGRVNIGAYGNTEEATLSAAQLVQVLTPNGLEKYEVGQELEIAWRSYGLMPEEVVGLINAGGGTVSDRVLGDWLADRYRLSGTGRVGTNVVDTSGVLNAAPESVYRSYSHAWNGVGNELSYNLPVPDGDYTIRLHFAEPWNISTGVRLMDISLQGVTAQAGFDLVDEAGGDLVALTKSFSVQATGGEGVSLGLKTVGNGSYPALISAIELVKVNAGGDTAAAVDVEVSTDNGGVYTTVGGAQAMNRFGVGGMLWAAGPETMGNSGLVRVTATTGTLPQDLSDRGFLIANDGNHYYVNDAFLTGDEHTSAVGDNANSGKAPDAPMASLAAIFRAYDLDAGDIIFVDTGNYQLTTNIVITSQDAGVEIRGPQVADHRAVLDRGNTASGSYVFDLSNADGVILSNLVITGAQYGTPPVARTATMSSSAAWNSTTTRHGESTLAQAMTGRCWKMWWRTI